MTFCQLCNLVNAIMTNAGKCVPVKFRVRRVLRPDLGLEVPCKMGKCLTSETSSNLTGPGGVILMMGALGPSLNRGGLVLNHKQIKGCPSGGSIIKMWHFFSMKTIECLMPTHPLDLGFRAVFLSGVLCGGCQSPPPWSGARD